MLTSPPATMSLVTLSPTLIQEALVPAIATQMPLPRLEYPHESDTPQHIMTTLSRNLAK